MKDKDLQESLANRKGLSFSLNDTTTNDTLLFQTLKNRGIKNIPAFSSPIPRLDFTPSEPSSLAGIEYWTDKFLNKTDCDDSKIMILVDNDADGMTSSAMLYKYLKKINYKHVEFMFSEGKAHGLNTIIDKIIGTKPDFLFVPDAATNDLKEQLELTANDIPYLILDHHDISKKTPVIERFLPVISNQRADNGGDINSNFTGVGLTYVFCKYLDDVLDHDYADTLLYLFAIGQVGDVSDVSDSEVRYLMLKGFSQFDTPLTKKLVDFDHMSAHELSFSIIPKINAACRVGTIQDKRNLLNGLTTSIPADDLSYEIRKRVKSPQDNKIHVQPFPSDFYEWESRQLNSLKSRQKSSVKRSLKAIQDIYDMKNFVAAVDYDNNFEASQTGLIATMMANDYQKPALVLRSIPDKKHKGQSVFSGSGRGFEMVMSDFKNFLLNTDCFDFCAGHPNAFGVGISIENFKKLIAEANNHAQVIKSPYLIDKVYMDTVPPLREVYEFDEHRNLFGGSVKDPKLGFVGLKVAKNTISFKGTTLTFMVNGLKFVVWGSSKTFVERMLGITGNYVCVDVYGEPDVNRYSSKEVPQILVRDIALASAIQHEIPVNFEDFVF